jgi:hypothetical protein
MVLAAMAQTVWNLGRSTLKTPTLRGFWVGMLSLCFRGIQGALLILGTGAVALALRRIRLQGEARSLALRGKQGAYER